ncbi:iron-containing redox enzyme family protein [Hyalangium versicolor]|uniref:iron-containing redox enzyme family protein n=1 Tax=Hyalangium versicolor TaxID=2861190 RepID=UPI001CCB9C17|nr:iron-containing redox enzyme family protein [Hyalangium versicolor]
MSMKSMSRKPNANLLSLMNHRNEVLAKRVGTHRAAWRLINGTLNKDGYCVYLAQSSCYVEKSSHFLKLTSLKMKRYPALASHLYKKSLEEMNHHLWCWNDLKRLGWSNQQLKRIQPCPSVEGYLHYHEAAARRGTPEIAGTAYSLETLSGNSAGKAVERLRSAGRIENIDAADSYLRLHGTLDDDHSAQLAEHLRCVNRAEWSCILLAMDVVESLLVGIFDEVERAAG